MTPVDRRRLAYELHRRFLTNVTGLTFGPAYMDPLMQRVGFRAIASIATERGVEPVEIISLIREREDLFR